MGVPPLSFNARSAYMCHVTKKISRLDVADQRAPANRCLFSRVLAYASHHSDRGYSSEFTLPIREFVEGYVTRPGGATQIGGEFTILAGCQFSGTTQPKGHNPNEVPLPSSTFVTRGAKSQRTICAVSFSPLLPLKRPFLTKRSAFRPFGH